MLVLPWGLPTLPAWYLLPLVTPVAVGDFGAQESRVWTDCRSAAWPCSGWARPWWWCSRPWGRWCSSTICMGIREGGNSSGLLVLFQYHGGWQNSKKLEAKVGWGQDSCATMFLRRGNLTQNTIENSLGYAAQFLWYLKAKFHLHGRKVLMKREC